MLAAAIGLAVAPALASASPAPSVPRLAHVFVIMEENNGFHDIIGNRAAPNLNYLARTFGLETDYFGVSPCCSESNYVGLLGGNTFGVNSDDAYWKNRVAAPSLISQLDHAGISWKAYLQALPHPDYQGICYPAKCNGAPDSDPLYVSKHDGIQNYTTSHNPFDFSRQVPIGELARDLRDGAVPRFSYVIPDECHDMHGDPPYCLDSGNIFDPQNQHLVAVGDAYAGQLVAEITHASFWHKADNAILITFDEGDNSAGCCDANPGAGQVATIVITSHGPRGVKDASPANHYSLLSTIQHAFGLGCLQFTCDTKHVQPLTKLVAVTGSRSIATRVLPELRWPTPTPGSPPEPRSMTTRAPSGGGWTVQRTQLLGTNDNSLGAVAGSSPHDVWAVGDFLPDAKNSNQDATLTFAEHYNGVTWSVVRTPNLGPNFASFYGVAAKGGRAWAVGERLNADYQDRALIEVWNGARWTIADNPQPGSVRDMLFGASAVSPSDVWVVGDREGGNGLFETLAEHWNGRRWSVVPTPDPGSTGNHLYAVDAVARDDVWAVGQRLGTQAPDQPLVEHWNGHRWSVVSTPVSTVSSVMLEGVAVNGGQVWVDGESDSPDGGRPIIEHFQNGHWSVADLSGVGSIWTMLYGIAVTGDTVWATGTFVNPVTDNNEVLVLRGVNGHWSVDPAPNPGSGSNILGTVSAIGGQLWTAGVYDTGGSNLPLIEHR
ncbi:MAG TPA: alkaline phosphatase family protein [Streptosporangiaceae bacterium]|nr:alkaline phosphatase family protein [Streptosporangiaceae bacterium]